jgi:hypothetical protein
VVETAERERVGRHAEHDTGVLPRLELDANEAEAHV